MDCLTNWKSLELDINFNQKIQSLFSTHSICQLQLYKVCFTSLPTEMATEAISHKYSQMDRLTNWESLELDINFNQKIVTKSVLNTFHMTIAGILSQFHFFSY